MNAFCKLICIVGTHLRKKWKWLKITAIASFTSEK
jgi:hypothetical protein